MPGATLQLSGIGLSDVYLTQNPQINIFKYRYFRYLNFATELVSIGTNESVNFGQKFTADIPYRGHLLSKLFLKIRLPKLQKVDGTFVCWTDSLGYALLDTVEFEINGIVYDRLYGYFLDMYDEFKTGNSDIGKRNMILKSDVYISTRNNAQDEHELMIPLDFWFTKQPSLALPLISMSQSRFRINFNLRKFNDLIHWDGTTPPEPKSLLDAEIYGEYIYLDDNVLDLFTEDTTYIIQQVQFNNTDDLPSNTSSHITEIKFNHTISELIFGFVETESINNNDLFNFSRRSDNLSLMSAATLYLDGMERFPMLPESYFRLAFPSTVHKYVPSKYVYCIPFSLKPEESQPTGGIDFSKFNTITLTTRMRNGNGGAKLFLFGVNYNIFRITKGIPNLEFI